MGESSKIDLNVIRERLLEAEFPATPLLYRGKSDTVHLPSTDPDYEFGLQLARFDYDEFAPENVPSDAVWNLWASAHVDIAALLVEVERLRSDAADPAFAALVDAARHLCWLCTEHAGLSEPEDLEAVGDVQRALRALGVDVDPVDEEVSGE